MRTTKEQRHSCRAAAAKARAAGYKYLTDVGPDIGESLVDDVEELLAERTVSPLEGAYEVTLSFARKAK